MTTSDQVEKRARQLVKDEVLLNITQLVEAHLNGTDYKEVMEHPNNKYPNEYFEFWAVDSHLAKDLEKHKQVVIEVGNHEVWCRTTTGQAIYLDGVILDIAEELLKDN